MRRECDALPGNYRSHSISIQVQPTDTPIAPIRPIQATRNQPYPGLPCSAMTMPLHVKVKPSTADLCGLALAGRPVSVVGCGDDFHHGAAGAGPNVDRDNSFAGLGDVLLN